MASFWDEKQAQLGRSRRALAPRTATITWQRKLQAVADQVNCDVRSF